MDDLFDAARVYGTSHGLLGLAYSHLDNTEQIILGTAYLEGEVTNSRLQSMLDLHSTEIGRILSSLVDKEMLVPNKKGRWTSYQLNENYTIHPEQLLLTDMPTTDIEFKNNTDRIIYEYICENGFITARQILDITRIKTLQGANVALGRLMDAELIDKIRKGRNFIYQKKS